jgi:uncharacterized membrane protein
VNLVYYGRCPHLANFTAVSVAYAVTKLNATLLVLSAVAVSVKYLNLGSKYMLNEKFGSDFCWRTFCLIALIEILPKRVYNGNSLN